MAGLAGNPYINLNGKMIMAERMRDFSEIGNHDGVELTEVWKKFKWGSSSEDEYFIENKVSVGQKRGFFGKYSYLDVAEAMFKALDLRFAHIRAVLSAAGASYEYDSSKDFDYGWEADRYEVMKNRVDFTLSLFAINCGPSSSTTVLNVRNL